MKRKLLAVFAAFGLVAAAAFADPTENVLFSSTVVIPAQKVDFAGPMKWGTAPSGKKALIVSAMQEGSEINYRGRIEFSTPMKLRGVTKIHVEWESLDESVKKAGEKEVNFSIFTLNRDDNKLLRAGTLDMKKRTEDKKSIFHAASGTVPFHAVYDADTDCQKWTDTLFNESTKQVVALEFWCTMGQASNVSIGDCKGVAITSIWFE